MGKLVPRPPAPPLTRPSRASQPPEPPDFHARRCSSCRAGLSAAAAGALRVTLVDREPLALHCAMSTAQVCGLATAPVGAPAPPGAVHAMQCDWAHATEALAGQADLVLGSEVLYDPPTVSTLVSAAASLLHPHGGSLLLAEPATGRAVGCRQKLDAQAAALGATVSAAPLPPAVAAGRAEPLLLIEVRFGVQAGSGSAAREGVDTEAAGMQAGAAGAGVAAGAEATGAGAEGAGKAEATAVVMGLAAAAVGLAGVDGATHLATGVGGGGGGRAAHGSDANSPAAGDVNRSAVNDPGVNYPGVNAPGVIDLGVQTVVVGGGNAEGAVDGVPALRCMKGRRPARGRRSSDIRMDQPAGGADRAGGVRADGGEVGRGDGGGDEGAGCGEDGEARAGGGGVSGKSPEPSLPHDSLTAQNRPAQNRPATSAAPPASSLRPSPCAPPSLPPPPLPPSPPVVEDRQAAVLRAAGYRWDGSSRRWVRGDVSTRDRRAAECRSSGRVARLIHAKGSPGGAVGGEAGATGRSAGGVAGLELAAGGGGGRDGSQGVGRSAGAAAAARRMEQLFQDAREAAMGATDVAALNDWKNELASPRARWVWAGLQLGVGAVLCHALQIDVGASAALGQLRWAGGAGTPPALTVPPGLALLPHELLALVPPVPPPPTLRELGLGLALSPALFLARRGLARSYTQIGMEPPAGQIERMLADAALGSHALPAPADWRASSAAWRRLAGCLEMVSACNGAACVAGVAQPLCLVLFSRSKFMTELVAGGGGGWAGEIGRTGMAGGMGLGTSGGDAVGGEQYAALLAPLVVIGLSAAAAAAFEVHSRLE